MDCVRCGAPMRIEGGDDYTDRWECSQCWVYALHVVQPFPFPERWVVVRPSDLTRAELRFILVPSAADDSRWKSRRDPG